MANCLYICNLNPCIIICDHIIQSCSYFCSGHILGLDAKNSNKFLSCNDINGRCHEMSTLQLWSIFKLFAFFQTMCAQFYY